MLALMSSKRVGCKDPCLQNQKVCVVFWPLNRVRLILRVPYSRLVSDSVVAISIIIIFKILTTCFFCFFFFALHLFSLFPFLFQLLFLFLFLFLLSFLFFFFLFLFLLSYSFFFFCCCFFSVSFCFLFSMSSSGPGYASRQQSLKCHSAYRLGTPAEAPPNPSCPGQRPAAGLEDAGALDGRPSLGELLLYEAL